MSSQVSPLAGKSARSIRPLDVSALVAAYYELKPDVAIPAQRVVFGTSGHRGSSLSRSFNEDHLLAIAQATCQYRHQAGIDGPIFVGIDTHALSVPAFESVVEVLIANGLEVMTAKRGDYTPTPAVSHAILAYNRGRKSGLADGIVITPSHNPPDAGGVKYNGSNGGPADTDATGWIEGKANALLEGELKDIRRVPFQQAISAASLRDFDFLTAYVDDLDSAIDFEPIRGTGIRIGVDPLGGAGVQYWARIADKYRIDLTVVSDAVDPTFGFMTLDWDGRIRMDPSSSYAIQRLIGLKDRFDIAFACDTDHDRHGIVTPSTGLLPSNHYLAVMVDYLFRNRTQWPANVAVGKTVVSSAMIDRVTTRLNRKLYEVPAGFKWFVDGLFDGSLGFGGEESAGASFSRIDGSVWTTDKDGLVPALLSAEITARTGRDPGKIYRELAADLGDPAAARVEAPATAEQKKKLAKLSPAQVRTTQLAGDKIGNVLDRAPGNNAPIGGIKVVTENGWFAARPSGTEDIYKIYAESFRGEDHLQMILREAQTIVDAALGNA